MSLLIREEPAAWWGVISTKIKNESVSVSVNVSFSFSFSFSVSVSVSVSVNISVNISVNAIVSNIVYPSLPLVEPQQYHHSSQFHDKDENGGV